MSAVVAHWTNGTDVVEGRYHYRQTEQRYVIHLRREAQKVTGRPARFTIGSKVPEWKGWRLVSPTSLPA